jgi:hypothetical protein
MKCPLVLLLLLCGYVFSTELAGADPMLLDQDTTLPSDRDISFGYFNRDWGIAQTFTVGKSGRLTSIDLAMLSLGKLLNHTVTVSIVPVVNGEPDLNVPRLASHAWLGNDLPQAPIYTSPFFSLTFDLSDSPLMVRQGDVLAIIAETDSPAPPTGNEFFRQYAWWCSTNGPGHYSGGATFGFGTSGRLIEFETDTIFRTFVTVPEPSMLALASLCGLLAFRRRK